jgi:hypothetical protein
MKERKQDPWTDPDPQPGDFDDVLDETESVDMVFDPEIRLISNEEAAERMSPEKAELRGLIPPKKKSPAR